MCLYFAMSKYENDNIICYPLHI